MMAQRESLLGGRRSNLVFSHMFERVTIVCLALLGGMCVVIAVLGAAVALSGSTDRDGFWWFVLGAFVFGAVCLTAAYTWYIRFTAEQDRIEALRREKRREARAARAEARERAAVIEEGAERSGPSRAPEATEGSDGRPDQGGRGTSE